MKRKTRIGIGIVAAVAALLLALNYGLGFVVKGAVSGLGTPLLGVPVKLDGAQVRLLGGGIRLNGFVLGNPEGFKTEHMIRVGEVAVDLDVKSLFRDTVVIRRIHVKEPEFVYELGLGKSNIGRLLEQLEGTGSQAEPETGKESDSASASGKKVVIEDFLIKDARVRLSATLAMGAAAPIPLPDIHMTDIGKEEGKQGASPVEVVRKVFGAIAKSVTQVVTGAVGLVGDGAKAIGKGVGKMAGGMKNLIGVGDGATETNEAEAASADLAAP